MDTNTFANTIVTLGSKEELKNRTLELSQEMIDSSQIALTQQLQTTLDLEELLEIFKTGIQPIIEFGSIQYNYHPQNIKIVYGTNHLHHLIYQLTLESEYLGELVFSRETKFEETEVNAIEKLLALLIYPIRNSLHYEQAVSAALTDPLTGCGNRKALFKELEREIDFAKRHDNQLAILIIDVDEFKSINDTYGHSTGDAVLRTISEITKESIRYHDRFYRYGGEEFVVILANNSIEDATHLAERAREAIEANRITIKDQTIPVTVSIGITSLLPYDTKQSLFDRADKALYQAKSSGKNQVFFIENQT